MVELFAGYVANVKDNAWEVGTRDELTWESWMAAAIDRSTFTSDVSPAGNERSLLYPPAVMSLAMPDLLCWAF